MNQPIGGLERHFIEFHRGVSDSVRRFGIKLQPVVVRRCDRQGADFPEFFQNRARQRRAFARLRAAADFVQKDQGTRRSGFEHRLDREHMRGKGAEMIRDRLLVADIGENVVEERQVSLLRREPESRTAPSEQAVRPFSRRPFFRRHSVR